MPQQFVKDFKDKDPVDAIFLVKNKNLGVGKNGKSFLTLLLGDKTGSIDSKIWDRVDESAAEFDVGDVIKVKGQIQLFQNRKQLIVHRMERMDMSQIKIEDFLPQAERNSEDMFTELVGIARSIKNPHIHQLVFDVLEDPEIKPKILRAPAAKSIHHAWLGGLLEHILSICKLMDYMASHYTYLNRDLLIFGAIFHDIGKIWELEYEHGINYTDRGRLVGHMYMSCELVESKSQRILGFNHELLDILKHIILSHHGKLEYGSPKRPKFMEAVVVAMIDELDSQITSIHSFMLNEKANGTKWSRLNDLHERYFYLEDLNAKFN